MVTTADSEADGADTGSEVDEREELELLATSPTGCHQKLETDPTTIRRVMVLGAAVISRFLAHECENYLNRVDAVG